MEIKNLVQFGMKIHKFPKKKKKKGQEGNKKLGLFYKVGETNKTVINDMLDSQRLNNKIK